MSLQQKQTVRYFGSGQMYVLSILIIFTTKEGSEHKKKKKKNVYVIGHSPSGLFRTNVN